MKPNQKKIKKFELSSTVKLLIKEESRRILEEHKDIENYIPLVEKLKDCPESTRLFSEVFQKGLKIINERGTSHRIFGFGEAEYMYHYPLDMQRIDPLNVQGLMLVYLKKNLFTDKLAIAHKREKHTYILGLLRSRGNLSSQRVKEKDLISQLTTGAEPLRNAFKLQPNTLTIEENNEFQEYKYGLAKYIE